MLNILWRILEKSKQNCNFNSECQFQNLKYILSDMGLEEVVALRYRWEQVRHVYREDEEEFDKLHLSNGGFLEGGDDTFYIDFPNWLVAQGEELYNNFREHGISAIFSYIITNNIKEKDYTYENMFYAFPDIDELEECSLNEHCKHKKDADIRRDVSRAIRILSATMEEDAEIPVKILQKFL